MEEIKNEISLEELKKQKKLEYNKRYYSENKEKMKKQITKTNKVRNIPLMIEKKQIKIEKNIKKLQDIIQKYQNEIEALEREKNEYLESLVMKET